MPIDPTTNVEVTFHTVDLKPTSAEYLNVKRVFNQTMTLSQVVKNPPNPSTVGSLMVTSSLLRAPNYVTNSYTAIDKIQRIQNPLLYIQYITRKKEVDKRNSSGSQNSERHLFHGTAAATCEAIKQNGFNRSYSGKNGKIIIFY